MYGSARIRFPCSSTTSYFFSGCNLSQSPCSISASSSSRWVKIVKAVTLMETSKWSREGTTRSHLLWLPMRKTFLLSPIRMTSSWYFISMVGLGRWMTLVITRGWLAIKKVSFSYNFLGCERSIHMKVPFLLFKSLMA